VETYLNLERQRTWSRLLNQLFTSTGDRPPRQPACPTRSAARGPFRAGHDTESTLLGASDSAYRVVVTALRAMYGDQLGDYRPIANTTMLARSRRCPHG
jgi:hypothetical protein